jgi:hypothetical protein
MPRRVSNPSSTMKIEITMATIGRLIKNSLIIMRLPGVKKFVVNFGW